MGLPNGEAPSHLALVADAKSPYSHPQPPAQAKDTWLWRGRLSAQPLPPPGVQGMLGPVGMETGKQAQPCSSPKVTEERMRGQQEGAWGRTRPAHIQV